jgi:hypothetical protein
LSNLKDLQGGLKKLSTKNLEKLKNRIIKSGFCAPFFIWDNGAGDLKIIDGHQRRAALVSLESDGYSIPPLPVDYIHAATEEEAREILLSVSSQYGEWVEEELEQWMAEVDESISSTLRFVDEEINLIAVPEVDYKDETDTRGSRGGMPSKSKMVVSIGKLSSLIDYEIVEQLEVAIIKKYQTIEEFCKWLLSTL